MEKPLESEKSLFDALSGVVMLKLFAFLLSFLFILFAT